ncbi:MAG: FUSC family protein [Pseudomonadota bacterium]
MRQSPWARIQDVYVDLDPAGLKLALAVKTVLGSAVTVILALYFAKLIPDLSIPEAFPKFYWYDAFAARFAAAQQAEGLDQVLPMLAAVITFLSFLLHPVASYRIEMRWFGIIGTSTFVLVSAVGLAGPGSWGYGVAPVSILWVAMITVGIYARRWGPATMQFGLLTAMLGVILVNTNPTYEVGFWFAPTVLIALVVTFVFRFLTIRPSAQRAYRLFAVRFLKEIGQGLQAFRDLDPDAGGAAASHRSLRRSWAMFQQFLPIVSLEVPGLKSRFAAQVLGAYRMMIVFYGLADSYAAMSDRQRRALMTDPQMRDGLDALITRFRDPQAVAFPSEGVADTRFADLHDASLAPERAKSIQDLQPARFLAGIRRLEEVLTEVMSARSEIEVSPIPSTDPDAQGMASRGMAARLALQAFVAASITTALQFIFDLDYAYWATMTVALVLNGKVGHTMVKSFQRTYGTAIGVVIAIALVPLIGGDTWLEVALIGLCMPFVMLTIERNYLLGSAGIGFGVAMLIHVAAGAGVEGMVSRAYETAIGAGVALLAAWLLFPMFSSKANDARLADFLDRCRAAVEALGRSETKSVIVAQDLTKALRDLQTEFPAIVAERRVLGRSSRGLDEVMILLDVLVSYINQYESTRLAPIADELTPEVRARFEALHSRIVRALEDLSGQARDTAANLTPHGGPPFHGLDPRVGDLTLSDPGLSPHALGRVIDHGMAGYRIGETLNDLADALQKLLRK